MPTLLLLNQEVRDMKPIKVTKITVESLNKLIALGYKVVLV